ncbi:hypothetical protein PCANC_14886 [Puccinia coronata f. sp. avenae]|uniref:Uncharacterized protein n=1 Tax=Puccinia coronata f. sp. avenae TaxID=200324 RepID=A0A2N5UNT5_9BASI|nr:hypothetical protein PCANC_21765 [Puccinia coronata f. sp. avenae]PLW39418.1 hypothetical protein PCANC_14886 [Puccinia coronata f. sp. avenae]
MLDQKDAVSIPMATSLANQFPSNSINQISQVQLNAHEVIHKSVFILITGERMEEYFGMVLSLWIANGQFFAHDIKATLNFQHDCNTAQCQVTNTRNTRIERIGTTLTTPEVRHQDDPNFILNSGSLHAPKDHCRLADLPIIDVLPHKWIDICKEGLANWGLTEAPAAACATPPDTPKETPAASPAATPQRINMPSV